MSIFSPIHSSMLTWLLGSLVTPAVQPVEILPPSPDVPFVSAVRPLTTSPLHHFVGYYGISPWNADGSAMFYLETDVVDRLVAANDRAGVMRLDLQTGRAKRVAETSAWNLQQGAMLHWLPAGENETLAFNDRMDGRLVTVLLEIESGRRRILNRPIAALSPDGSLAIGIDYDRLRRIRPVTGYAGGDERQPLANRPADDGLFLIDVKTGESRLILSVETACQLLPPPETLAGHPFWLEHALFSRDGKRLFAIVRAFDPRSRQLVSLPLVLRPDGAGLKALLPWSTQGASHFDWLDDRHLVLTREVAPTKWHHLLFDVTAYAPPRVLAPEILTVDGHSSFSPDGKWMVTDSYPDANHRQQLFLLDVATGVAARVASFAAPDRFKGDWRCDLHPRWSRNSKQICIDSTHDGTRQVYLIDLKLPAP